MDINMEELTQRIKQDLEKKFTPENMKRIAKEMYEEDRQKPENFSNWYPYIKKFGNFRRAEIVSNQILTFEETEVFKKTDVISKVNWEEIKQILKPTLDQMENNKLYSLKNGCFSDKFNNEIAIVSKADLPEKLWKLNYDSALLETGGFTEVVVRELIPHDYTKTPTIYNGLPLREEMRVFYNLDTKEIEYMEDYWKLDYCEESISNKTDAIVFKWFHNKLRGRHDQHTHIINVLKERIKRDINTIQFDSKLTGIWSIDFMYVTDSPKYNGLWLVDMARGERSAYWNPARLKPETRKLLNNKNKENKNG